MPPSTRTKIVPHKEEFKTTNSPLNEGVKTLFPYDLGGSSPYGEGTFHVNYLKNQFKDLARPNQFKVNINPPSPLKQDWNQQNIDLLVLAKSAKIPSMEIKEVIIQRAGQKLFLPSGEVEHGEASITFYNDSDYVLRTIFNRWMRLGLHNWEYNIMSTPNLSLDGEVIVYHYDYKLQPIYAVTLVNAWPKNISEIELSQESGDTPEEFTVTFNYSYQYIEKTIKETA